MKKWNFKSWTTKPNLINNKKTDLSKENKEISQTLNSTTLCDMIFGCLWYRMIFDINEDSEAKKSISSILELLTLTKWQKETKSLIEEKVRAKSYLLCS